MRVCVVTGGALDRDLLLSLDLKNRWDRILGVDRGAQFLAELGLWPDLVLGDLDSAEPSAVRALEEKGLEFLRFPPEKDLTDTHLALEHCRDMGATEVLVLGATGNRLDHMFANLFLGFRYRKDFTCVFRDPWNEVHPLEGPGTFQFEASEFPYLSILPVSDTARVLEVSGVRYPLGERLLERSDSLGISNEVLGTKATLRLGEGKVLVFRSKD
ncbi:thiamine diphosphokinase [Anaerotalea alkaliphila]|uniref:Thiamine diphosphokinase n=1 Tax=Anaerotalea alkaliphila TaxID=2662126 RepID=A0A7X5HUH9_9FIRM|nr:thiamine diphosphokinase [Anaerotalea alkaliphila]NDL66883.1 thiamine diphosphokinase [Anaerotalea alkaliphila]